MASVNQYKVASDGVYFGDVFFDHDALIPSNRLRNAETRTWMINAGAIVETTTSTPPPADTTPGGDA